MPSILQQFKEEVGELVAGDVHNMEYSQVKIDEQIISQTQKFSTRHRCSQRLGKGLFFTDSEKAKRIKDLREINLP